MQLHRRCHAPAAAERSGRFAAVRAQRVRAARGGSQQAAGREQQLTLQGTSYEQVVDALAERALAAARQLPQDQIHLVGIAGAPGSGKSTLARLVADRINASLTQQQQQQPRGAVVAPMDGFHLYRAQLDAMPDPQAAHARRGAPWTFDGATFVDAVTRLRGTGRAELPSFDHGVGDPVPGDVVIDARRHCIVLLEGNYLFLDEQPWVQLRPLLDDAWFVDCDLDTAMRRVFERQTAIGVAPEQSRVRIASNDRPNGELVNGSRHAAAVLVPSTIPLAASPGTAAAAAAS